MVKYDFRQISSQEASPNQVDFFCLLSASCSVSSFQRNGGKRESILEFPVRDFGNSLPVAALSFSVVLPSD
jgi:hypothetical protein